ncbi:2-phosphosulfolactate phosphatase family protein [Thermosynechococcaceae cyanobacterium BACA0444]|uniref:Probable 2-phosphosulfolactate phosphatase n=1 Tax=Pseudocalidococcus azoricus BACA0444 TaxID=2918990 RepID=A0AAE4FUJ1_9CYAN|nr:2-phosphosulfolactate phosphatase family protein [Pseudocalidococcus azoricus BACA0444]
MQVYIYHTPERVPPDWVPDCAIAVDVLRATTTIATALAAGAEAVQVFSDLEDLEQVSQAWPAEQRIRVGERGGKKVEGFDLGNSPFDCTPERVKDCRLFMSTTNGTRSLARIQSAKIVLAAALVNRAAVVNYVHQLYPPTVWIVGSGWEGAYSLEDTVCAGAIAHSLWMLTGLSVAEFAGNDETVAALALYRHYEHDLLSLFHQASHGQRLLKLGSLDDLKYCAQTDILDVLPIQTEPKVLVAG